MIVAKRGRPRKTIKCSVCGQKFKNWEEYFSEEHKCRKSVSKEALKYFLDKGYRLIDIANITGKSKGWISILLRRYDMDEERMNTIKLMKGGKQYSLVSLKKKLIADALGKDVDELPEVLKYKVYCKKPKSGKLIIELREDDGGK